MLAMLLFFCQSFLQKNLVSALESEEKTEPAPCLVGLLDLPVRLRFVVHQALQFLLTVELRQATAIHRSTESTGPRRARCLRLQEIGFGFLESSLGLAEEAVKAL